ncbi:MAG: anthranilate/aminodeoxychorismate synthase component II [Gammaproteobacteria bacterium]|nr:anthranilate/aminodeoxychorismate synthase component II [Gammaproteobacteria bacterium]
MIDNYDSFTYNLVQYLGELGARVTTWRNDVVAMDEIIALGADAIVLSPGPCTPNEAGICLNLVEQLAGILPILGVCLGHQCIGQAFGARIVQAQTVMHGKTSQVTNDGHGVFQSLPGTYRCTRYHSLVIEHESLPSCFELSAWIEGEAGKRQEIMGIRHRGLPIEGVQFHPESIMTEHGHALLDNFLTSVRRRQPS